MANILAGKIALVTGASGAIGRATALAFAREGALVAVSGLEPELTEATTELLRRAGATAVSLPARLENQADARVLLADVLAYFGDRIDILANISGMSYTESVEAVTDDHFNRQLAVNFIAPFWLSQGVLPIMKRQGSGCILFTSSTGARSSHPNTCVYDAMKAGLESLTRGLAVEMGPYGIRVNAIEPGHILNGTSSPNEPTPARLAHWKAIPLGRPGVPEDVAETMLFLASPGASYITGTILCVDGGRTARSPVIIQVQQPGGINEA